MSLPTASRMSVSGTGTVFAIAHGTTETTAMPSKESASDWRHPKIHGQQDDLIGLLVGYVLDDIN